MTGCRLPAQTICTLSPGPPSARPSLPCAARFPVPPTTRSVQGLLGRPVLAGWLPNGSLVGDLSEHPASATASTAAAGQRQPADRDDMLRRPHAPHCTSPCAVRTRCAARAARWECHFTPPQHPTAQDELNSPDCRCMLCARHPSALPHLTPSRLTLHAPSLTFSYTHTPLKPYHRPAPHRTRPRTVLPHSPDLASYHSTSPQLAPQHATPHHITPSSTPPHPTPTRPTSPHLTHITSLRLISHIPLTLLHLTSTHTTHTMQPAPLTVRFALTVTPSFAPRLPLACR